MEQEKNINSEVTHKKESKFKLLLKLFFSFFKIGLFTFGGGYAMIPLIQKEVVDNQKWVTEDDVLEIVAIAESTPGPISINSATFVGYRTAGFWGAFFATFGLVLPSFVIIFAVSFVLKQFQEIKFIKYAFWGIRAGVLALIIKALWGMFKKTTKGVISFIIMALSFITVAFVNVNPIYVIIGCAVIGLISSIIIDKRSKKENK